MPCRIHIGMRMIKICSGALNDRITDIERTTWSNRRQILNWQISPRRHCRSRLPFQRTKFNQLNVHSCADRFSGCGQSRSRRDIAGLPLRTGESNASRLSSSEHFARCADTLDASRNGPRRGPDSESPTEPAARTSGERFMPGTPDAALFPAPDRARSLHQ